MLEYICTLTRSIVRFYTEFHLAFEKKYWCIILGTVIGYYHHGELQLFNSDAYREQNTKLSNKKSKPNGSFVKHGHYSQKTSSQFM